MFLNLKCISILNCIKLQKKITIMTSLKKRAIVAATEGISEFKRLRRTLSDEDAFGIIGKKFH